MKHRLLCLIFLNLLLVPLPVAASDDLQVPAFTAYIEPNADGARVSERAGITRWNDKEQSINWYGRFSTAGKLRAAVQLILPEGQSSSLRLTIEEQSSDVTVRGLGDDEPVTADFGAFEIRSTGYRRIRLQSLNSAGQLAGNIRTLNLAGPALHDVLFNLKERRNAASVHLFYPVPDQSKVQAFYCEVTAAEDPTTSFYMACGWHRGYFGMQVNSSQERRIIFSVWDSGNEGVDRNKVAAENRVILMGKGEGVYSGDFGNEGTGGHSHLKYPWRTGEVQKFVVTAEPVDGTFTIFSGYWFQPDDQKWMLISSWRAPKEQGSLKGLHSFSENFGGFNGHLLRQAEYGNQWIRTSTGEWRELTTARFSHDPTGKTDRMDRSMGVASGRFYLQHGGFTDASTTYGEEFQRPASQQVPAALSEWEEWVTDRPSAR